MTKAASDTIYRMSWSSKVPEFLRGAYAVVAILCLVASAYAFTLDHYQVCTRFDPGSKYRWSTCLESIELTGPNMYLIVFLVGTGIVLLWLAYSGSKAKRSN
jgi:hypothetical protein